MKSMSQAVLGRTKVKHTSDFVEFLELACQTYETCPCKFVVNKLGQADRKLNYKTPTTNPASHRTATTEESNGMMAIYADDLEAITINAFYDNRDRLTEVALHKDKIPRILIQLFGIIMPLQPLLSKLEFKKCLLDGYFMHELIKFLPLTSITEISLDETPLPQENYALLLQSSSNLTSLSLCRCGITDVVCEEIATTLHIGEAAEAKITILNLSSNHITDAGAKYFGEALRTNRHLRYLNLADNRITDIGAGHIFRALTLFPLTYDEIVNKCWRRIEYLKLINSSPQKYSTTESKSMEDLASDLKKNTFFMNNEKHKPLEQRKISLPAEVACHSKKITVSETNEPFNDESLKIVNGYSWCVGNMVLCSLNLSFNSLSFISLKKLQSVLFDQSQYKKQHETGMVRILMQGNLFPILCSEMESIQELLSKNVIRMTPNFRSSSIKNKRNSFKARIGSTCSTSRKS